MTPIPAQALGNILQHLSDAELASIELTGVHLVIDDPALAIETFSATPGVTDVFVFDGSAVDNNFALIANFDGSEDYILFRNMDGRDVFVGILLPQPGSFGEFFIAPSEPERGQIEVTVTHDVALPQSNVEAYVLTFDGNLLF